jgi:AraC family transcriptional regulator
MDNNLLEIIKNTTEYIETHLLEDINLDSISENVNMSKFHLLRIWKGATGVGLMEYVRRRRIAMSLSDLIHAHSNIEYISSKYSFGCERTYNRAFKEEYNTTPAKWRRGPVPLKILDCFNADFMNIAGEGLIFLRSITVMPALILAGLEYKVDVRDNYDNLTMSRLGVDFFYNHRLDIINPVEKDIYYGLTMIPDHNRTYVFYQPSLKIDQNSIIAPDMKIRHIKPHKYGVFTYMGSHRPEEISARTLEPVWKYIDEVWKPTIKFDLKEAFRLEYINYAKCSKSYCECDLYYPISQL